MLFKWSKNAEYYQLIKLFQIWAEYTYKLFFERICLFFFIIKNDKLYSFNLNLYNIFENVKMMFRFNI